MAIDVKRLVPQHLLDYPVTTKILEVFQHVIDLYGEENVLEVLKFYDPLESTTLDKFLTTFGVRDMVEEILNDPDINVVNFAPGATVISTSEVPGHEVPGVHDEDPATYLEFTSGVNEGLDFDLGTAQIVRLLVIDTAAGTAASSPGNFVFMASVNGLDYETLLQGVHGRASRVVYQVENEQEFRWYRLVILDTGGDPCRVYEIELYRSKAEEMRGLGLALKSLLSIKGTLSAVHYTLMRGHAPTTYDFIEWFTPEFELDPTSADVLEDFHGYCSVRIPVDDWVLPPSTIYQQTRVEAKWISVGVFLLPWFLRVYQWIYLKRVQDQNPAVTDYLFSIITQYVEDMIPGIVDELDTVVGQYFNEHFCINSMGPIYGEFTYGDGSKYGTPPHCSIYDIFYGVTPQDTFMSTVPGALEGLGLDLSLWISDGYSFPPTTDRATIITEFRYADIDTENFDVIDLDVSSGFQDIVSGAGSTIDINILSVFADQTVQSDSFSIPLTGLWFSDQNTVVDVAATAVISTWFQDTGSQTDNFYIVGTSQVFTDTKVVNDAQPVILMNQDFQDVKQANSETVGVIIRTGAVDTAPANSDGLDITVITNTVYGQVVYGSFTYGTSET